MEQSLSPRRVRAIAVAKDILAQLRVESIDLTTRSYVYLYEPDTLVDGSDLDAEFDGSRTCLVCAIGACVMSRLRLYGATGSLPDDVRGLPRISMDTFMRDRWVSRVGLLLHYALSPIFSRRQRRLIESAFQMESMIPVTDKRCYAESPSLSEPRRQEIKQAIEFGIPYQDINKRLQAIMENVVENDGLFVPCPKAITTTEESTNG